MRIIFLNFFSRQEITGGIKVSYRCVEMLAEAGYDAAVWQPAGKPDFLESTARVITEQAINLNTDDILVFPEALNPAFVEILRKTVAARKILFCQNPYNLFNNPHIPKQTPRELGFSQILCVSGVSKGFLSRIFNYDDIATMTISVDGKTFAPLRKRLQIAFAPRKLRWHADLISKVFRTKFPGMRNIPWVPIDGVPEARAAEIMGESAVYLATGQFESCPLMALEAMSAGCAIVGYHGYGGLEYATPHNGFWHYNDEIEEVVDDLYRTVKGLQNNDALIAAMVANGRATAAHYNAGNMRKTLLTFFENLPAPQSAQQSAAVPGL